MATCNGPLTRSWAAALSLVFLLVVVVAVTPCHGHGDHTEREHGHHGATGAEEAPYRSLHDFDIITDASVSMHSFKTFRRSAYEQSQQPQALPDQLTLVLAVFSEAVRFDLSIHEHLLHPDALVTVRKSAELSPTSSKGSRLMRS